MLRVGSKQLFHNQHTEVSISVSFMNLHVKAQVIYENLYKCEFEQIIAKLCVSIKENNNKLHMQSIQMYVSFIEFFIKIFHKFKHCIFTPHKCCKFTGIILWYYHRTWVTCEFNSTTAQSTRPRLSDTTVLADWS